MGTGTSFVEVKDGIPRHLGGIGIGGGTIMGLSKIMLNTSDAEKIRELASGGEVGNIDLRIGDISKKPLPGLDLQITASNFGKASSRANCEDKAAGIVHMVIETICQAAVLIANGTDISDFVLTATINVSRSTSPFISPALSRLTAKITTHIARTSIVRTLLSCESLIWSGVLPSFA